MAAILMEISKEKIEYMLRRFMDAATREAKQKHGGFSAGIDFGQAYGIYSTLECLEIIDKETAEELRAVLYNRKEEEDAKPDRGTAAGDS